MSSFFKNYEEFEKSCFPERYKNRKRKELIEKRRGMIVHELKIWPQYFEDVLSGRKKFEIRNNDRNFKVGDFLILKEYSPNSNSYSKREIQCKITYLLNDPNFIKEGFVVMSIELISSNCFSDFLFSKCRKCGNQMELKGDMRYEDLYWKCSFCGWEKPTIIRG